MKSIESINNDIDEEVKRLEQNPEELKRIEEFSKIGDQFKPVYGKLTRKTFHNFIQCCKHEGVSIGEKFTQLCEEYAGSNFEGKKEYDAEVDWKSLQARNQK